MPLCKHWPILSNNKEFSFLLDNDLWKCWCQNYLSIKSLLELLFCWGVLAYFEYICLDKMARSQCECCGTRWYHFWDKSPKLTLGYFCDRHIFEWFCPMGPRFTLADQVDSWEKNRKSNNNKLTMISLGFRIRHIFSFLFSFVLTLLSAPKTYHSFCT